MDCQLTNFVIGAGDLGGSSGDVLTASLVEQDESSRVASSHHASDAAPANTAPTLLESNFDHQAFSDGFTFHVTVRFLKYSLLIAAINCNDYFILCTHLIFSFLFIGTPPSM